MKTPKRKLYEKITIKIYDKGWHCENLLSRAAPESIEGPFAKSYANYRKISNGIDDFLMSAFDKGKNTGNPGKTHA